MTSIATSVARRRRISARGFVPAVVAVLVTLVAAPALAQTNGVIRGAVRGATGPLAGTALVTDAETNSLVEQPLADGVFEVSVPQGRYLIAVRVDGESSPRRLAEEIPVSRTTVTALDLEIRGEQELIQAISVTIAATEPGPGTTLRRGEIAAALLESRQVVGLIHHAGGASVADGLEPQGAAATSGVSFVGQRARANGYRIDGLDGGDPFTGGLPSRVSLDAFDEFQVLPAGYPVEFGKSSGGIISVATRRGGQRPSATAFAYVRDERLNAKEHFERFLPSATTVARPKAPYDRWQFGTAVSGQAVGATAYFVAYEGHDVRANNFVTIDDQLPVTVLGRPAGTAADILRRAGFAFDTGIVPYRFRSDAVIGRVDRRLTPSHDLMVRAIGERLRDENAEAWGGDVARSRGGELRSTDVGMASIFRTQTSRWFNELRGQVAFRRQNVRSLDPACSGSCEGPLEGGPTIEVVGIGSLGRMRFLPQPRETVRYQVNDTWRYSHGESQALVLGADYSYIDHPSGSLPLHFGGRYVFAPLPAIPPLVPSPISAIEAVALGVPAAYVQGYGDPTSAYASWDLSLFAQHEWRLGDTVTMLGGLRYQRQAWPAIRYDVHGLPPYTFPDDQNLAPRLSVTVAPRRWRVHLHGAYGVYYENQLTSLAGISEILDAGAGVRTLVGGLGTAVAAWSAPGRRLPVEAVGSFPSLVITVSPELTNPFAHHAVARATWFPGAATVTATFVYARGLDQVGTLDYNPLVPQLGPGRRPADLVVDGVPRAGTSASVLQYTSFGETWYRGLVLDFRTNDTTYGSVRVSYTLSSAEDTSSDYQSAAIPADTGRGRNPGDPTGLPLGFDPRRERGPSLQDQRHRLLASVARPLPLRLFLSARATLDSGRPFNILAGADLNGDGNGGAVPPDRPWRVPNDLSTTIGRNLGRMPMHATVDVGLTLAMARRSSARGLDLTLFVYNLFNRSNFTDVNRTFGPGAYPANPLPTFGQFLKAGAPRQAEVALRLRL